MIVISERESQPSSAGSFVGQLGKALFLDDSGKGLLCMLSVYLDDSGTHDTSPFIGVAGYLSSVNQWINFERNWREALDSVKPDFDIDYFRMADFENRRGQFQGMDKAMGVKLQSRLLFLIKLRSRIGGWATLARADYEGVDVDAYREQFGSPYSLCARSCILSFKRLMRGRGIEEPIAFMVEQGTKHGHEIKEAFDFSRTESRWGGAFERDSFAFVPK